MPAEWVHNVVWGIEEDGKIFTYGMSNFVSSGLVGRNMKRNMEFGEMFVWEASDAGIAGVVGLGGCMRPCGWE